MSDLPPTPKNGTEYNPRGQAVTSIHSRSAGHRSVVRTEVRDGMRIDWDVPVSMDDGLVLRADVYRPIPDGKYPVLLSYGPYGKWLHFEDLRTGGPGTSRPG